MAREHLGLFDTPPSRLEIRLSLAIVAVLFAAFLLVLPVSHVRLNEVVAFVPAVNAIIFVGELIIATLLFAQAAVFRSRALTALAAGFVFIALLVVPYVLTFPGAFAPDGLLGAGTNTAAWIMIVRRLAFPVAVILYVFLKRADSAVQADSERPPATMFLAVSTALLLAAAATILTTVGHDWLPPMFLDRSEGLYSSLLAFNFSNIALIVVAMAILFRNRRSVLDMWLMVALAGWLIQSVLNLPLQARFTVGWYCLHLIILLSHLFVLLALIAESNRLYARLALSTAARNRERDTRMMSMDAVAAAFSHEVGQPLAAVTLNASAGLEWLTGAQPNPDRAINSLRETIDAGRRTFDVIRSIRATFAQGRGSVSEFSLNDLVRETASLLDRELVAEKVSLELALDEGLPPILANRTQIQRVLINLLMNAIESVGSTRRRKRLISIRSSSLDGQGVLLEVSDSGVGIDPEKMPRIFEPFFTTKATGTGLGLSLSRIIVEEEHGGRLWASPGDEHGATFHLQLRRGPSREW